MLSGGLLFGFIVYLLSRECERGESEILLFFITANTNCKNESAKKEATDKYRSLKTQLLFSTTVCKDENVSGERIWKSDGFFGDLRPDLKLDKKTFLRTAFYMSIKASFLP